MATEALNASAAAWKAAIEKYRELSLSLSLNQAPANKADAIEIEIVKQEELLLGLEAPSLAAVLQKLEIIFETDLEKPDRDGAEKRLIIDDLCRLHDEAELLVG
ncbi:hypothetical protein GCM10009115_06080 [Sphingopyxis soli]|uniref:Uncharacterized protein n=1 Tax=Sphingopyxis soli TaxID=592051 RepID=A0ABP3XBG3_9SPHN|nr:hypothetical protein [Sphingopyxis soli]